MARYRRKFKAKKRYTKRKWAPRSKKTWKRGGKRSSRMRKTKSRTVFGTKLYRRKFLMGSIDANGLTFYASSATPQYISWTAGPFGPGNIVTPLTFNPILDLPQSARNFLQNWEYLKFMKVTLEFKPRAHVSSQSGLGAVITTSVAVPPVVSSNAPVNNMTQMWLAREHDPNVLGGQTAALTSTFGTEDWFLRRQPRALCNFPLDKGTKYTVVPNNVVGTTTTVNIPSATDKVGLDEFSYKKWNQTAAFITAPSSAGEFGGMVMRLQNTFLQWLLQITPPQPVQFIPEIEIYATYDIMLKGMDERDAAGGV